MKRLRPYSQGCQASSWSQAQVSYQCFQIATSKHWHRCAYPYILPFKTWNGFTNSIHQIPKSCLFMLVARNSHVIKSGRSRCPTKWRCALWLFFSSQDTMFPTIPSGSCPPPVYAHSLLDTPVIQWYYPPPSAQPPSSPSISDLEVQCFGDTFFVPR